MPIAEKKKPCFLRKFDLFPIRVITSADNKKRLQVEFGYVKRKVCNVVKK